MVVEVDQPWIDHPARLYPLGPLEAGRRGIGAPMHRLDALACPDVDGAVVDHPAVVVEGDRAAVQHEWGRLHRCESYRMSGAIASAPAHRQAATASLRASAEGSGGAGA